MAIIYTYPTKTTPVGEDLVLISDSEDVSETKNATITSIMEILDVVDTLAATLPLSVDVSTGAVTMSSRAYAGGATTGYVPSGGVAGQYLDGAGSWVTASGSGTVTGTGTASKLPKWSTGGAGIEDSIMIERSASGVFTASYISVSGSGGLSTQDLEINAALWDGSNSKGASSNILSSTGTGVSWIEAPTDTTYTGSGGITLTGTNFTNSGVTSLIAGSNISLSASLGDITVSATSNGQTPVDYATATAFEASGGNEQYFYMFTCNSNFTISTMNWYQGASSSQVVTWGIYSGNLTSATLIGQGSATANSNSLNLVNITAEASQSLNLLKGQSYVIAHQQSANNGSVACLTTALSDANLALTAPGSAGLPSEFPDSAITYTATSVRPCVSLIA